MLMAELEYTGNRAVFKMANGGNTREFAIIYGYDQHGGDGSGVWTGLKEDQNVEDAYNDKVRRLLFHIIPLQIVF